MHRQVALYKIRNCNPLLPPMPKRILIDEFQLSFRAPSGLPESEYFAMLRTLQRKRFIGEIREAVHALMQRKPTLRNVTEWRYPGMAL